MTFRRMLEWKKHRYAQATHRHARLQEMDSQSVSPLAADEINEAINVSMRLANCHRAVPPDAIPLAGAPRCHRHHRRARREEPTHDLWSGWSGMTGGFERSGSCAAQLHAHGLAFTSLTSQANLMPCEVVHQPRYTGLQTVQY